MSKERSFVDLARALARDPAARNFADDAAVLEIGGERLVLTHDIIVEEIHFLSGDRAEDVAWKLVAVNVSDLAAKGARPVGALLGYTLGSEEQWDAAFLRGLDEALGRFGLPLLGGDTVRVGEASGRVLGMTALGLAAGPVPPRDGALAGDDLWVSGTIGDAGAGLRIARGELAGPDALLDRYRRPQPRIEAGLGLAGLVHAMMDVSDGLLIDAGRLAEASKVRAAIALDRVPLSTAYAETCGGGREARLAAATAGDDYELIFAASPAQRPKIANVGTALALPLARIGRMEKGAGLRLSDGGRNLPLPPRLGYEH